MTAEEKREIRDHFAAAALCGLLSNPGGPIQANPMNGWDWTNSSMEATAKDAYKIADAMLAARPDDEPAAPAQEPDWRDEIVGWGTGWEKHGLSSAIKRTGRDTYWQVFKDGSLSFYKADVTGKDHLGYGSHIMGAPVSRCRTIDRFLSELAGEGVK